MNILFAEAATLHPGQNGYALAYGSHATGTARVRSDLDLLYVGHKPLPLDLLAGLVAAVKKLHSRHGLDVDEEVPYPAKLYATVAQTNDAASLGGFPYDAGPTPTRRTRNFLSTEAFRLRLVFNVLTTPHVFLRGDVAAYRRHVALAERSAAQLALRFRTPCPVTPDQAVHALWRAPTGEEGKDFLGYLHAPHLLSVLNRGFSDLHAEGITRYENGAWYQPLTSSPADS